MRRALALTTIEHSVAVAVVEVNMPASNTAAADSHTAHFS